MDLEFTRHMEEELDHIEDKRYERNQVLQEFYDPFDQRLKEAGEKTKDAMKDAADKTSDALKKAGDKLKTATNTNK